MENIIVALSNYRIVYPICLSYSNRDYLTLTIIIILGLGSFISHLIENHKHGMSGIGFSIRLSYYLNRFDVFMCILISCRLVFLYYYKYKLNIMPIINSKLLMIKFVFSLLFMIISEYDKYNPKLKYLYIITHCIWHMSIFSTLYDFLNTLIY